MRIVFAGTPEFAVPSLKALHAEGHEILGVITREDAPLGRKRIFTPSPVAQAATELGLTVFKANRLGDDAAAWVAGLGAELGVIVAYGGLVRDPLLTLPTHGWINLHFSDLPRWRGAAPVQRALMAGEQRLGLTVFRLVEALDAGDVLTRDEREFTQGTSAGEALTELSQYGTHALLGAVELITKNPGAGTPQEGDDTYAHKLTREDGRIKILTATADSVLSHWAGVTPEPGAFALLGEQPLKLTTLQPVLDDSEAELAPGEAQIVGKRALLGVLDGAVELTRVQPASKPVMDGVAWLRGRDGKATLS
ncbi:methionyl-tRNA formyltransferase [Leucobacter denitrificans]|uniref:Methionyl-tRNA formyltransferase n=1 Tax=Leucobacter denitrificans TaxID=683042 RepID=A0A7G9S624_9MICO|nr:methionyl-tRNA formyltransferase [Leucobacter denitrificans]QNN63299.1 methionyl-tRNA formyltransferase [Leucobacter denitrificans]